MYCSIDEVRNAISVTDTADLSDATIIDAIEFAEDEIDRLTFTTYYPVIYNGTATSSDDDELTDSAKSWIVNELTGYAVYIYDGAGLGQIREIKSNTATAITTSSDWDTNPTTTSKYIVTYLNKQTLTINGSGRTDINLRDYPIVQIDSLTIEDTLIDPDNYTVYHDIGKIVLGQNASKTYFTNPLSNLKLKQVEVTYHWGVLPDYKRNTVRMNGTIRRGCVLLASLKSIASQIGGTYNVASTWGLPEMNVTRGQAYVNLGAAYEKLNKEWDSYRKNYLGKYVYMV